MHELAVTQSLIEAIISECEKNKIKQPTKIIVDLGYFTSYAKESILMYYEIISKEFSKLNNTTLEINEIPGKIKCNQCKKNSIIKDAYMMFCTHCHSSDIKIIQGKEFIIKKIMMEE